MDRAICLALIGVALASGCGQSHGAGDGGATDAVGPRREDGGAVVVGIDAGPHDLRGNAWLGYIVFEGFRSRSSAVFIALDEAPPGDGPRTGVIVFGVGEHPPPATDGTIGYPPDAVRPRFSWPGAGQYVHEGYVYPIHEARIDGSRMRVTVDLGVVWTDWCRLQTAYPIDPTMPEENGYECLPNLGWSAGDVDRGVPCMLGDGTVVDCGLLALCGQSFETCDCTAEGCTAQSHPTVTLDVHVRGDTADGTIRLYDQLEDVHLERR